MGHAVALGEVRAWWRVRHPPPSFGQRLDIAYTAAIVAGIFGAMAYGTASSALSQVVTPEWLAAYGPSLALLALLVIAHWGAYLGPVVYSVPDVAFLLGAPLPRRGLAARRLVRSQLAGAAGGALVAAVVIVGLAGQGRGIAVDSAAGLAIGLAELAVLGVAAAWLVERSARWERVIRRATWPALLAAVALALVPAGIARWSGPWGWAVQAGTGAGAAAWLAALVALTALTAVAGVAAVRSCGHCPAERHLLRAEARASAIASLASYDARTARRSLERVSSRRAGGRAAGLGRLRDPRLAIAWRDVVAGLRTPGRVLEGAVLTATGTVLAVLHADRPVTLGAGMLAVYFGAARLLWPLRGELDVPDRAHVLLRPRLGQVLLAHALVPVLVTAMVAALAAAGCVIGGADPAVAAVAVAVAPLVTACAGNAGRREGRLPPSLLAGAMSADPSGGLGAIVMWFALWPLLGVTLGALPLFLATRGGAGVAALAALGIAAGLAQLLGRDVKRG